MQQFRLTVQYFYDGPKPALDVDNPFKKFLDIPHTELPGGGAGVGMEQTSYINFDERLSQVNESHCDILELDFDNVGTDLNSAFSNVELYSNDDESDFTSTKLEINEIRSDAPPIRAMLGVGENSRCVRSHHEIPLSHICDFSGRWGNVMVSKYTRDIINEVEKQAKVSVWPSRSSFCVWAHRFRYNL